MEEPQVSTRQLLGVLWTHAKKRKGMMFLIIFFVIFAQLGDIVHPYIYKLFIDGISKNHFSLVPETLIHQLFIYILALVGISFFSWICWRFSAVLASYFVPLTITELCRSMALALFAHSVRFYQNNFSGSLVKRIFRIGDAFDDLFGALVWNISGLVIALLGSFIVLYLREPMIALVLFVGTLIMVFLHFFYSRWKMKYDILMAEADSKSAGEFSDMITNFENIKLFTGVQHEKGRLKKVQGAWSAMAIKTWQLSEIADAAQAGIVIIVEFVLLYTALHYWRIGVLTVGDFALIQGYFMTIISKTWSLGRVIRNIYRAIANGKESAGILLMMPEIRDVKGAKPLKISQAQIVFEKVRFGYQKGQTVLKKYSMTFKAGKRYALVGPSGSGKSTIGKVLLRLFDLQSGHILIDGQDIKKVTLESLRSSISVVPQDPVLFHRTLMENIRYGNRDTTDEEVIEAAKKARCHEFIENLSDGYETYVGERGIKLSGGERQRVAIARAILKNAPILVLDEATSSLDSESESLIQEALGELMKGKTTIVIAHRLSTIMKMDQIVVMEQGKVVDVGSHKQLLRKKKSLYRKLWEIQAGGFIGG
ncbi:MAG: ABC transporter ATP-binding protein [Candidatus Uhrbacteria bacterium GW2011_GWE2_40_58]|nr:MAG: ABC transporter ATP-binding protein [Candidatus Uhrbacteria bacterium GW2011_GWF2_40_263]KKR67076.1 MAG: ABC transporter ATP-binding protein [Candidatus Uhrbacteria bacterium GW2011_GWE2_40_58]OGL93990.1 MAG: hypothetical protein A2239_04125 [Candidatus Uhrbacteria bacterium RIFOXYA2_FULL_40_9]OGL97822.1 MAG: hypothetical protein A2332_02510 [Candidatus Uhrbacteria bacterium RIFOXYB2_FULL_41_18]